jgi:hypothetical protein
MQPILLHSGWHIFIGSDNKFYFEPGVDDTLWQPLTDLPVLHPNERLWMRHGFEMPLNDECSTWWLELATPLPTSAQVWVNYEPIDLQRPLDVTYAVFMGKNVVTVYMTEGEQWQKFAQNPKIILVPRPCLL